MKKITVLAVLALISITLACAAEQRGDQSTLTVVSTEMRFGPNRMYATTGSKVRLRLENQGAVLHDLNVQLPGTIVARSESQNVAGHAGHHSHAHAHHQAPETNATNNVDANLHLVAEPGKQDALEFVPTQPGVYRFFCSVPGHRAAGMVGELIVK